MSNATIRRHLERTSAPVVAMLMDQGWVVDDCGILNSQYGNIREGILVCTRALNGAVSAPMMGRTLCGNDETRPEDWKRERERL